MRWWKKQKLKSRSPAIRRQTLEAILGEGNDADLDLLIFALNDSSAEIRCLAARGLGALRQEGSVPGLLTLLRDVDPATRRAAVDALGRTGDPRALPGLESCLTDSDAGVRARTARALKDLGWQPQNDLQRARFILATEDPRKASEIGPAAIEPLTGLLQSGTADKRIAALEALGRIGDARALKPIIASLRSDDASVRAAAVDTLGRTDELRHFETLLALLRDRDAGVRTAAVEAVVRLGGNRALPAITNMVNDSSWEVRHAVILCLGGLHDPAATNSLTQALSDKDTDVREAAANALGQIKDPAALGPLVAALNDTQSSVRRAVEAALYRIDHAWESSHAVASALPQFQSALQSPDFALRQNAQRLLEKFGCPSTDTSAPIAIAEPVNFKRAAVLLILADLIRDRDRDLREAAALALGHIGGAQAQAALGPAVQDSDPGVQRTAMRALEALR